MTNKTEPLCYAEPVSASDLFLPPLTDAPFISVHTAVFSDVTAEGRGCVVLNPPFPRIFYFRSLEGMKILVAISLAKVFVLRQKSNHGRKWETLSSGGP